MRTRLYYLSDGKDGEVRYIGKTGQTLQKRLSGHLADRAKQQNHRAHWLRAASDVHIHLIAEVDGDGCAEEIDLIASLRALGARLVNGTAGGEGTPKHTVSEDARARMSAAKKGRKQKPEHVEKRRLANTGRYWSAERRAAFSEQCKGRKASAETLAVLRASHRVITDAQIAIARDLIMLGSTQTAAARVAGITRGAVYHRLRTV